MISPSGSAAWAVASASVRPSTVGASPSTWPPRMSSRMSVAVPPARCRSSAAHAAARQQVGEDGRAGADGREVVEGQLDAALPRDRQEMQEAVRRAAAGDDARHRVLQRAPVEEAARRDAALRQRHGQRAGARGGGVLLLLVGGGDEAVPDEAETEHVDGDGHGVRGEVARAVAGAGTRRALDRVEVRARHAAAAVGADRLPHVLDRDLAAPPAARRASGRRTARRPGGRPVRAP